MGRAKIYWLMHLPETFEVQAQEFQKLNSLFNSQQEHRPIESFNIFAGNDKCRPGAFNLLLYLVFSILCIMVDYY